MGKRKPSRARRSQACSSPRSREISRRRFLAAGAYVLAGAAYAGAQDVAPPSSHTFSLFPVPRTSAELRQRFTEPQLSLLEKLNRRDVEHLLRPEPAVPGLIVPGSWTEDELAFSPMPAASEWAAAHAKAIVVHQPAQVFGAYENGQQVRWGPVSTGRKETPTPAGEYSLTWRSRKRRSTDNDAWVLEWYFNFINERGVSFHQFDLPGYPASHACVRLLQRDAMWLYEWGEQWTLDPDDRRKIVTPGSAVWIVGVYDYKLPAPWIDPVSAARTIELPG
jgi:L,D-transpeptidase catalytic domain